MFYVLLNIYVCEHNCVFVTYPHHVCVDLLILYGKFYLTPSGKMNRVLVARIIHTLMKGYCFQTDELRADVFSFFSTAMQYVRYVASACLLC